MAEILVFNNRLVALPLYKQTMELIYGNQVYITTKVDEFQDILINKNISVVIFDSSIAYENQELLGSLYEIVFYVNSNNSELVVMKYTETENYMQDLYGLIGISTKLAYRKDFGKLKAANNN